MTDKPEIEILLATMNRENLDFIRAIFPQDIPQRVALLIVNQSEDKKLQTHHPQIRIVNSPEKGLSKSRNTALQHARGEICVFTDDDVVFLDGFEQKIRKAFAHFPQSSFIRFRYEKEQGILAKDYPNQPKAHLSDFDMLNTSSLEMAIRRRDLQSQKIRFDEHFGLGSGVFKMGEEHLFLAALQQKGLQLSYFPETLCRHRGTSSDENMSYQERYYTHGAVVQALFPERTRYWIGLKIGFDVKQKKLKFAQIPKAVKAAKNGQKRYLKIK